MEEEAVYTFIYKTVREYYQYEDYIEQKLQEDYHKPKTNEGYLIDKKYYDYWKKFTNYDEIKNKIKNRDYLDAKPIIYQYRRANNLKVYQSDAKQYLFYKSEDLINALNQGKSFVLINQNIWFLICTEKVLRERGGVIYILGKNKITFVFSQFDNLQIVTYDNIIDNSNEIYQKGNNSNRIQNNSYNKNYINSSNNSLNNSLNNSYNHIINNNNNYNNNKNNYNNNNNNFNINNNNDFSAEDLDLRKILLLYAYEQEIKKKINNLKYKDKDFQTYFLISKDWILEYKKCYRYDEICRMIQKKDVLKALLNNGYDQAKRNMHIILKKISFNNNNAKKYFPENLRNNNTFLSERNKVKINNQYIISYWKNFEIINEDLKNLLSKSESHNYFFDSASDANCLICSGKIVIDLSKDEYNENNYVYEIGLISNNDMLYYDEYLFRYEDEESKNDNLNCFKNDFLSFQREKLNFGIDLECDLLNQNGYAYGTAFKIPPHD